MVNIYGNKVFIDRYKKLILIIEIDTDLGLIILQAFPRLNKWITPRIINYLEILPRELSGDREEGDRLHVRNLQKFTHQILMNASDDNIIYDFNTKNIINEYRKNNK